MSEGGRIQRLLASTEKCNIGSLRTSGNLNSCSLAKISQPPITPSEGSRINLLTSTTNGTLLNGGGITQERVKQLLSTPQTLGSEGVRISLLEQATIAASDPPSRLITRNCAPTLTPPPAPPLRPCVSKNMKLGS